MVQIVKRKKKGRPSKVDLARQEPPDLCRSIAGGMFCTPLITMIKLMMRRMRRTKNLSCCYQVDSKSDSAHVSHAYRLSVFFGL
ncbi:hypothetical protein LguiB_013036 [Lonicera macranthoides]